MPILFQESVRGLIDSSPGLTLVDDRPGTARIYDAEGRRRMASKVDPDLVLRAPAGRLLLLDTKYKDALPPGATTEGDVTTVGDRHRIKVSRSDIYQAVAYREHDKWPKAATALLYPIVLAHGEDLPKPLTVHGFGTPISLLFVDIGYNAMANLPVFLETLRNLLDYPTSMAATG